MIPKQLSGIILRKRDPTVVDFISFFKSQPLIIKDRDFTPLKNEITTHIENGLKELFSKWRKQLEEKECPSEAEGLKKKAVLEFIDSKLLR